MNIIIEDLKKLEITGWDKKVQNWFKDFLIYLTELPLDFHKFEIIFNHNKQNNKETIHFGGVPVPNQFKEKEEFRWIRRKFVSMRDTGANMCLRFEPKEDGRPYFTFPFLFWLIDSFKTTTVYKNCLSFAENFLKIILEDNNSDFFTEVKSVDEIYINAKHVNRFLPNVEIVEKIIYIGFLYYNDCLLEAHNFMNSWNLDECFRKWSNGEDIHVGRVSADVFKMIVRYKSDYFLSSGSKWWELIHPKITEVSKFQFDMNQYGVAVRLAFVLIIKEVKSLYKEKTSVELDGFDLMSKAFNPDNPIIFLTELDSKDGKNFQKGYQLIFMGVVLAIRNLLSHDLPKMSNLEAVHKILIASDLMYVLSNRLE